MSERATKLFRLLINPATADGERRNAAAMLNACMESEGIDIAKIGWKPLPPVYIHSWTPPKPRKERKRVPPRIPFGKYKGLLWCDIPSEYLAWILDGMTDPQEWLVTAVTEELERRGEL
jgi:hypothetical protein